MLDQFARLGVDPCGERGEYHTAVLNGPLFSSPIEVGHGERVLRSGCHALDLEVVQKDLEVVQTFRSAGLAGLKACTTHNAES